MGKGKLKKFTEMKGFRCVFEPEMEEIKKGDYKMKGCWNQDFFKNDHPLVLELGCGKGEYTVGMSQKYPNKNFIGVDIKGARIWRGAKTVQEKNIPNAAFLRTRVEFVNHFFDADEVDEIWLTFSDPQPKKERKRLSSPVFLDKYRKFLKKGGLIHLKTDNQILYEYTLEVCEEFNYPILKNTDDVYGHFLKESDDEELKELLQIQTFYEQLFSQKGFTIKYLCFQIN